MTRLPLSLLIAAPLALGLAACGDKADTAGSAPQGAVVAAVPAPAGKAWSDVVSATPDGGMLMGNPNAPIKLVEYGSLSCPHCARFAQEGFPPLKDKYINSGRVNLEFRSFAIHPQDVPLTVLAKCAGPDTFFPLIEQLYVNFDAVEQRTMQGAPALQQQANLPAAQRMVAMADTLGFTEFFAARGISTDQSHACLADGAKAQEVADQGNKWTTEGISSTPTFVLNGTKLASAGWAADKLRNDPGVEAALQAAGAR